MRHRSLRTHPTPVREMPMTDTCPDCLERGIRPRAERTDDTQLRSAYRCPHCQHAWITNRLLDTTAHANPTGPDTREATS